MANLGILMALVIYTRGILPRYDEVRYDESISVRWKIILGL